MKKRVFVAIDLSEKTRKKAADYLQTLRSEFSSLRVGWERTEKLHLTLKFLGEMDEKQLDDLTKAVGKVAIQVESFTIQIAGTGQFGKRVLWLGVNDKEANLVKIHELLETETVKIGFEREAKRFNPHLTIARLREPQNSGKLIEKHLARDFEPVELEISEIVIYESRLLPTGSTFHQIKAFPLKTGKG